MKRQRTLLGRLQATSRGGCEARALHATTRRLLELTRAHVRAYNSPSSSLASNQGV